MQTQEKGVGRFIVEKFKFYTMICEKNHKVKTAALLY